MKEGWKEGYEPSWQEIQKAWAWAYEHNYVYGSTREVVSDYRTYGNNAGLTREVKKKGMKYIGQENQDLGRSGHIVDMLNIVLSHQRQSELEGNVDYCRDGIDYLERDCEECNLCNYGRDCHNNPIA